MSNGNDQIPQRIPLQYSQPISRVHRSELRGLFPDFPDSSTNEPGFVKEVGLILIYTLIFMVLFYGWLVMLVIGLFIWHGQILTKASKIILVAFLGYAGSLLFVTTICIIHWDKHPYRPKAQVKSDKHRPQEISLDFIDLRRGMGGESPSIPPTQEGSLPIGSHH